MKISRRRFLKGMSVSALAIAVGLPEIAQAQADVSALVAPVKRPSDGLTAAQRELVSATDRFRLGVCGRRWGKSTLVRYETVQVARQGGQAILITDNRAAKDVALRTLHESAGNESVFNRGLSRFSFRSGGAIQLITYAEFNHPFAHGLSVNYIGLDEAAWMEGFDWSSFMDIAAASLVDRNGRVLVLSTPRRGSEFNRMASSGLLRTFQFSTLSNPYVPQESIDAMRADMSAAAYQEQIEAQLIRFL